MTASLLLALICSAWLLQLVCAVGLAVWRHRRDATSAIAPSTPDAPARSASAWPAWREFRVSRREFEDRAQTQCSFHLVPVDGCPLPAFRPGQYLTFSVPIPGSHPIIRCYSLSDRPSPSAYRITVKRVASPAESAVLPAGASSNYFHDHVQEGDVLKVRAPAGRFCIDEDAALPAVFIAGGIGITPLLSMVRWCVGAQPARPVHLFYALRSGAYHAFKTTLDALALTHPSLHLHVIYSQPAADDVPGRDYHHAGHLDVELLRRSLPAGRFQVYVCGPPSMMRTLVPALKNGGVPDADIHFEAFGPASGASVEPAGTAVPVEPIEVGFRLSKRTLVWDGRDANLLELADRHDVVLASGCRSGSCGTCETRILSGSVEYVTRPEYDIAPGHCLPCVARPQRALVLEA